MFDLVKIFSSNLKRLRDSKDLSDHDLAKLFGVSYLSAHRWVTGKNIPSPDMISSICVHFNITPAQLYLLPEEMILNKSAVKAGFE